MIWYKGDFMELNKWRLMHLAAAEAVDAWRIVPRLMVAGYAYMLAYMLYWYMSLKPYVLSDCVKALGPDVAASISHCIMVEPTTQHTALISAVVGISAGVFGFYANSGRPWTQGVFKWPIRPGEIGSTPTVVPVQIPVYTPQPVAPPPTVAPVSGKPPTGDDI